MSEALKEEIDETIAAIETVSIASEAEALWAKLKQQMEDAYECLDAYDKLDAKIEEAFDFADEKGADEVLEVAYETVDNFDAGVYDAAGALAAIDAINDAMFEYNLSVADGTIGFPVTELYVTNPNLRTSAEKEGWTITVTNNKNGMPAWGHECIEFWSCDFTLSQTIEGIPNGKYVVRVQGFYREGSNDSGTKYNNGTENITAELFANDDKQALTSIYKYTAAEMGVTTNLLNGYVNGLESAGIAFNTINNLTERNYYDDNEVEVIVMDGTLTFGVRNASTVGDRWCIFRDFQLYYYGNYPCVNLKGKMDMISAYFRANPGVVPNAVVAEVNSFMEANRKYTIEQIYGTQDDVVNAVILQLDSVWAGALEAAELFAALKAQAQDVNDNLLPLNYPGKNELKAVLDGLAPYLPESSTVNTYANMVEKKAELEAAIADYYFSQVATPEQAADYTFLVPNKNFEQKGNWEWSVAAGGSDQWIGGCRPTKEGGSNRQGVSLWGWGITSVDVHQRLTGLPDGLYKVSAEMITQTNYATDQHVYATSANKVTSENLSVEGWDTYEWAELTTTDYAVVIGGRLTIGAESSIGGTNSEGWFQATNFKLYYHGPASTEYLKAAWENTEARANDALAVLIPNEKKELAAAMEKAIPLAVEEKYGDACALVSPLVEDLASTVTATKNFYNDYYSRLNTMRLQEGYENCEKVYAFADATIAMVDEILESDTATCELFPDLNSQLQAYAGYVSSLRDAEDALNNPTATYLDEHVSFLVDSIIVPQNDTLLCQLATVEYCNYLRKVLDKAVNIFIPTANFSKKINEGDVTYLIVNPTCDIKGDYANNVPGWTWVQGTGDKATFDAEHYDTNVNSAKKARFLNSWGSGLNSTFHQEIIGIPDGTYRLTVAARTDGNNAYIFAATTASGIDNDTTAWTMVKNYGAFGGEIWKADSLQWAADGCPEARLEENYPYFMARPDLMGRGEGYGWSWHVIDSIEVTNHFLSIGLTAGFSPNGAGCFTGWWMSADDWKLELIDKNEVQSEFNPSDYMDYKIHDPETRFALSYVVDKRVVNRYFLRYGEVIDLPAEPIKEGYTFSGWHEVPKTMPAKNVSVVGVFTINKYLVTFKNGDEVIAADSLEYGAEIIAPEVPYKEGYTFNWSKVARTVPAHDVTYEGSYSVNSYLLTYAVDGETVQSDSVTYGTVITLLDEPTKEGYTFSGWSEAPETMPAHDVTISGTFTINKYLVTFKIGDEVIVADSLEYGATIVAPEVPEKEGYTFDGWKDIPRTMPANDLIIEGVYTANEYLLTFVIDGAVYEMRRVRCDEAIPALEVAEKEGYTFAWENWRDAMPAKDYTMRGGYTPNSYAVIYVVDGVTVHTDSVTYGTVITLLDVLMKEGYTFSGWLEIPNTMPAHDIAISGSFAINTYKVYYYVGEELVHTVEVAYGEAIPEYIYEPTGEGDIFEGWVGDTYATMPAHDVTYTANIESGIGETEFKIQNSEFIYDLMGRKVLDTENLKGGMYIVNGRKVVIK